MSDKVTQWLRQLGLDEYSTLFASNDIDWELLGELGQEELKDIGISSAGHRIRILKAIRELEPQSADADQTPGQSTAALPPGAVEDSAERRQLTVMFCDLVGSTSLSRQLDPEDYRDIIRSYQDACAGAISRFEGYVARYVGDALLVYFGFPRAHEDDAERAVRSALAILSAMDVLAGRIGRTLKVRIGIATGRVIVGDIVGDGAAQEQAVVGETPNLAARLQAEAEPQSIVIAAGTRDLIGEQFGLADLGIRKLKGFSDPVRSWRVMMERPVASRFGAAHPGRLTTFVGRDQEVELLVERWRLARSGEGQLVLLSGEAGIGKSRIIHALRGRLGNESFYHVQYQCSPHHTNSPLHPAIEQLASESGIRPDDSPDEKLDKIESLVQRSSATQDIVPLLAELLSIPGGSRYPPLEMAPQERKQKILLALVGILEGLARQRPLLFTFEDAHWIDPTTLEQIDLVADRVRNLPVLVLVTHRPEFEAPWTNHAHCTVLALNRLGREDCRTLVADVSRGQGLPEEILMQIISRTDGVPLFVEELTKAVLESEQLERRGDRYVLSGPLPGVDIPATLQDSLMARLDRLGEVKVIAQIGAAIGREFSYRLLDAVAPLHGRDLDDALAILVRSEIVFRRGVIPDASYMFKHALIQDAAYESLLHSRRRQIHSLIAEALHGGLPEEGQVQPEVIARHYTEAELLEQAAPMWLQAGQLAVARSANHEAIAHLRKGFDVLSRLRPSLEARSLELDMCISLGTANIAAWGYSAEETEEVYERGRELLDDFGDDPRQFAILHGLCSVYINQAKLNRQLATAEEMFRRAKPLDDPASLFVAHRVMAVTQNARGRFAIAREHAERAAALYDPRLQRNSAFHFGHDQGVSTYRNLSVALAFLGHLDASARAEQRASALTRELDHATTTLYNSLYSAFMCLVRRDWGRAREIAEPMIDDAAARSMALWVVFGRHLLGSTLAAQGESEAALREIHGARAAADRLNHHWLKPMTLRFEAQALADLGRPVEACARLDEALALVEATEEHWWEAEIHRYYGNLKRLCDGSPADVESHFQRAIEVARNQESRIFELRASTDLARLWRDQGKDKESLKLIAAIFDRFEEGFDSIDLKDARSLINELS